MGAGKKGIVKSLYTLHSAKEKRLCEAMVELSDEAPKPSVTNAPVGESFLHRRLNSGIDRWLLTGECDGSCIGFTIIFITLQ